MLRPSVVATSAMAERVLGKSGAKTSLEKREPQTGLGAATGRLMARPGVAFAAHGSMIGPGDGDSGTSTVALKPMNAMSMSGYWIICRTSWMVSQTSGLRVFAFKVLMTSHLSEVVKAISIPGRRAPAGARGQDQHLEEGLL